VERVHLEDLAPRCDRPRELANEEDGHRDEDEEEPPRLSRFALGELPTLRLGRVIIVPVVIVVVVVTVTMTVIVRLVMRVRHGSSTQTRT
jgi:hypothetical protein